MFVLIFFFVLSSLADPTSLLLQTFESSSCSGNVLFSLAIPLDVCLNNHDFASVDCTVLHNCINKFGSGSVFPYESLVNCTGAESMYLSVSPTYSDNKIHAKVYPISKTCFGIPIPKSFSKGDCASAFAVSSNCGFAGAAISWQ